MALVADPIEATFYARQAIRAIKARRAEREAPAAESPLEWAKANATIVLPTEGRQRFQPYEYQERILEDRSLRRIIHKARQTGISNVISIEALHKAITRPDSTELIVSRNQDAARVLIRYCQHTLGGLKNPPVLVGENQSELAFANGSRIVSLPASPSTGRGFAATDVYLDEFAFAQYDDLIYESVIGTVSTGGSLTILSTSNGRANMFFRLWSGLEGGEWSRHTIHWSDCPRYDEAWAVKTRAGMTRQAFAQEYDLDFAASGDAVFDTDDLAQCKVGWNPDPDGCEEFVHGWDIGRKRDHTVGTTWGRRGEVWHLVAFDRVLEPFPVQQNRIDTRHRDYGGRTAVESNGQGDPVIENLTVNVEPYNMTARTKVQAIQSLQLLIQQGRLKHGVEQLDRELSLYQWNDEKLIQDCVISAAIAATLALEPVSPLRGAISARMAPLTSPPRLVTANLPSVNGRVPTMTQAQRRRSELIDRSTNGRVHG